VKSLVCSFCYTVDNAWSFEPQLYFGDEREEGLAFQTLATISSGKLLTVEQKNKTESVVS